MTFVAAFLHWRSLLSVRLDVWPGGPFRLSEGAESPDVLCRHRRVMHQQVGRKRHLPFARKLACLLQQLLLLFGVVFRPLREVEMTPAVIDVVDHPPRHRRHISVPGPTRVIRMAVATRPVKYRGDVSGYLNARRKCRGRIRGRVGSSRSNELNRHGNHCRAAKRESCDFPERHHGRCPLRYLRYLRAEPPAPSPYPTPPKSLR